MRLTLEAMPRYGRPRRWEGFTHRNRGTVIFAVEGRGINFHRKGGVSFTGFPSTGGTTICWGRLRRKLERYDEDRGGRVKAWVRCYGPIMVRSGEDF